MLTSTNPTPPSRHAGTARVGLALAGGGPLGAIYEIGALCALDESIAGLELNNCHAYVGVSAGGFLAASLANGISPRELGRAFIENEGPAQDVLHPGTMLHPAWGEFARRLVRLPGLVAQAAWRYVVGGSTLLGASERLGPLKRTLPLPTSSN